MNTKLLTAIKKSALFDGAWYSERYPDVLLSGIDPASHYVVVGALLQRDPGPKFCTSEYLRNNPDIEAAGESGFLHYLEHGERENRAGFAPPKALRSRLLPISFPKHPNESGPAARVPAVAVSSSVVAGKKLRGDLNVSSGKTPMIRGWLAAVGEATARFAELRIDGQSAGEVPANMFRADLKKNKINEGNHAFEWPVPELYIDGQQHLLSLHDRETGVSVKELNCKWTHNRSYHDFTGFLANSYVNPYICRPFREEDKRCFAAMENVASHLVAIAESGSEQPLVSVIMPCFNRMDTIATAVESVLGQSYGNFQLILVDDASTDGTLAWCKAQADSRIEVVELSQNSGASSARNAGLRVAKGDYVMYLDSDNRWDARYIAAMVGAFLKLGDADAVYSGQVIYHGANTEPSAVRFGSLNKSLLLNHNYIDMNAFCHTRKSYKRLGGFDIELKRYVDWDLILRFAQKTTMYSVPVLLSHYYLGKAANTITADERYVGQLARVREKHSISFDLSTSAEAVAVLAPSKKRKALKRRVSIVIPSYESLEDLRECVDSILSLNLAKVDIIVVDNASTSEVIDYIKQQTAKGVFKSICNTVNYGFTHAVNQGIALSDPASDIVLLNNDAILTEGCIEALQAAADRLPDCGLVVPQQVLPGGTKTLLDHVPYATPGYACDVNLSAHHANIVNPAIYHSGDVTEVSFAPFFCVYIPRAVFNATGPLDAQFGRHYRSDRIYCDVVRHVLGLRIYHVADSLVLHKLQKSTDSLRIAGETSASFDLIFRKNQWDEENKKALGFATAAWDS